MLSGSPEARHRPVLVEEVAGLLALPPGGVFWDLTVGDGGHAAALLGRMGRGSDGSAAAVKEGRMMGLDRDPEALRTAGETLAPFGARARLRQGAFGDVGRIAREEGWPPPDGVLMDLGASTRQLVDPARGFSFSGDGPLDMRMDPASGRSAADLVNALPEEELARLFREYGEERWAGRIARALAARRARQPFSRTADLAQAVASAVPGRGRLHPATRVFQALRIAVNDELGELARGLDAVLGLLPPGGRLSVITFHSLEDRIVKRRFREAAGSGGWRLLNRKVIRPSRVEQLANRRSRSAKLRGIVREAA